MDSFHNLNALAYLGGWGLLWRMFLHNVLIRLVHVPLFIRLRCTPFVTFEKCLSSHGDINFIPILIAWVCRKKNFEYKERLERTTTNVEYDNCLIRIELSTPRGAGCLTTQHCFVWIGPSPMSNPFFYISPLTKKVPLSYSYHWKLLPLRYTRTY